MAKVLVSTPLADRIDDATSSSTSCRRASRTTLSPRSAIARAYAAPTPSDAPATRAHGPYRSTNPGSPAKVPPSAASAACPSTTVDSYTRTGADRAGPPGPRSRHFWNPVIGTHSASANCIAAARQCGCEPGQRLFRGHRMLSGSLRICQAVGGTPCSIRASPAGFGGPDNAGNVVWREGVSPVQGCHRRTTSRPLVGRPMGLRPKWEVPASRPHFG